MFNAIEKDVKCKFQKKRKRKRDREKKDEREFFYRILVVNIF